MSSWFVILSNIAIKYNISDCSIREYLSVIHNDLSYGSSGLSHNESAVILVSSNLYKHISYNQCF